MNARVLGQLGWPCPDAREMGEIDRDSIEQRGLPARQLMENAGRAVAAALRSRFPEVRRPLVLCGGGNNGGDGFVVARVLHDWDDRVVPRVLTLGEPRRRSVEAEANLEALARSGLEVQRGCGTKEVTASLPHADAIVDALFGVGLRRDIEGWMADVFHGIAASGKPVIAVDLPSGISADTGAPWGEALSADLVVTLGLPKLGLALRPFDAEILVADIGLSQASLESCRVRQHLLTREAVAVALPARPPGAHKGTFGHVLVVAGSEGKTGAALLAASGSLRAGAGLVTLAVPRGLGSAVTSRVIEAMTVPVGEAGSRSFEPDALDPLIAAADARDAAVLGPGLGQAPGTRRLVHELLARLSVPTVVDADGLNLFADRPEDLAGPGPRVLTPHPGEAARLLGSRPGDVQADRVAAARELARRAGAVVVLKGARSVIASPDGELRINPTGGPALASGGSGDVLAGVIGALLAQGMAALPAAAAGTYLHGLAGDLGPAVGGLASEVAERLPEAWSALLAPAKLRELDPSGVLRHFP